MADAGFITHKDKQIYYIDFTGAGVEELKQVITKAKASICQQPECSLLTITNVTGVDILPEISNQLKAFANHNKPYVKAGAVLGVTGLKKITYNAVLIFTGRRNLHLFDDMQSAKDWLVTQ